ncbi:polysaccharide deacetylase [Neobacillus notoginsengisoli]|uniref:Polysaccharide deacetylase n=1 Tax=Neobacillus notoginsengisoli TaxID=1578198 RepID=A0A417YY47_9BACI|nr:polysaccharide deacetylase family protein [Neobacillus notoginsengisoli]RHW42679.1 polysaccharide deacetylase [Neobacillus notoginsengisoli]
MGNLFRSKRLRSFLVCIALVPLIYGAILGVGALKSDAKSEKIPSPIVSGLKNEYAAEFPNYDPSLQPSKPIAPQGESEEVRKQEPAVDEKKEIEQGNTEGAKQPVAVKPGVKPAVKTQASAPAKQPQTPAPPVPPVKMPTEPAKPVNTGNGRPVYLTFDDGPHNVSGQILDVLDKYNAKATFFMLDGNMKQHPAAVKRMASSGHSLGLHGVTHSKTEFYKSAQSVIGEMNQARATVKNLTGIDTVLIRTPFGSSPHMTPAYKQAVIENGYKMWDWTVDSRDWAFRNARYVDSVIEQLEKQRNSTGPIVILLHERPETLAHLPALMEYLKNQNYTFQPLNSEMTPVQLGR